MRRQPFCLRSSEPPVHLGKSGTFFSLTRIGTREQGGSTSRFARYDVRSRRRRCMGPPEPVHPRLSGGPCGSSNAPLPRVRPSIHEDDVFALVRDAAGQAREIRSPCLRPSRPPVAETRDPATTVSRTIRSTVSSHRLRAPTAAPSRQDVLARRSDPACGSGRVRLRRDRRRLLRRTGTAICPRVHRDALGRRTRYCRAGPGRESPNRSNARARRTPAGSRAAKTQTRSPRPPARSSTSSGSSSLSGRGLSRRVPPPVVRRDDPSRGRAVGSRSRSTTAVAAMFHSRESPRPRSRS